MNNHWLLISLNINGLNSPIKRQRLRKGIQKQDPSFCCIQETHLDLKDRHYLRIQDWEKIFQTNGPKKQAGVAILTSNKNRLQTKINQRRQRRTCYISHRKNLSKEISILNIYAWNTGGPPHM